MAVNVQAIVTAASGGGVTDRCLTCGHEPEAIVTQTSAGLAFTLQACPRVPRGMALEPRFTPCRFKRDGLDDAIDMLRELNRASLVREAKH